MEKEATPLVEVDGIVFPEDARELSGFGGRYEEGCRRMTIAGFQFLQQHHGDKPDIKALQNVFGLTMAENEAGRQFERAMLEAPMGDGTVGDEATGAMVHQSTIHAFKAHELGWKGYLEALGKEADDK